MKRKRYGADPKILKHEVVTDQSDPRMFEFRESYGEFKPGCMRKMTRMEITEYAPDGTNPAVTTKFGYYVGEPPPAYSQFFRKLFERLRDD